jgi:hypothetical protein
MKFNKRIDVGGDLDLEMGFFAWQNRVRMTGLGMDFLCLAKQAQNDSLYVYFSILNG